MYLLRFTKMYFSQRKIITNDLNTTHNNSERNHYHRIVISVNHTSALHCTEVHFVSLLSGRFTTMNIFTQEKKLANRTSFRLPSNQFLARIIRREKSPLYNKCSVMSTPYVRTKAKGPSIYYVSKGLDG